MSKKKKNRVIKNTEPLPEISRHECKAEVQSPSRGRFEERQSDQPDGVTGNYS